MQVLNHVPILNPATSATGCCALIVPSEWDERTFLFDDKPFAVAKTNSIFHMPLNMSAVMSKTQAAIDEADAAPEDWLILSKEISPWHAEHYFAVTKDVPGLEMRRLSGEFITKVFEGPYSDARHWYEQLADYVKSKGKVPEDTYFFYTTCPKCAKAYGKNYVVGFEKVAA